MVAARLDRYPFPVAHPAHLIGTARDPADRLERAGHSIEMIAVTLGVLSLGWSRTRGQAPDVVEKWERAADTRGIALGGWISLLEAVRPVMTVHPDDPLARAVGSAIEAALPRLRGFTPIRNQHAHGGRPRVAGERETAATELENRASMLVDSVESIAGVHVAVVRGRSGRSGGHSIDLDVFTGYAEAPSAQRLRSSRQFQTGAVLAYSRGSLEHAVDLTPFCIQHACQVCGRDELFYLTKRKNSRRDHFSFATGHELRIPRDREAEAAPSLVALGMESLGTRRIEAVQGWRASWADLAPRNRRLAARLIDGLVVATIITAIGTVALLAGLPWPWTILLAATGALGYEPVAALRGGTLGKRLLGIAAVSVWDSRPLTRADELRRATFVDLQLLLWPLGVRSLAWLLWDPARQPFHDRWAGSFVITGRPTTAQKR